MQKLMRIGGLLLVNLLLLIVLLEGGLRLMAPALPPTLSAAARWVQTGQIFPAEWSPAWQQNSDHQYALRPGLDNAIQYGSPGVRFRLSTIELWDGGGIGFRTAPVDFKVDAVVVGDSFGLCFTERSACWVTHLAERTGWGVVNLSQPVTGTTSHARILRDFGQPLEPPLVIWQFFGNDFYDDYGLAVFRDEIEPVNAPDDSDSGSGAGLSPLNWLRHHSVAVAVIETAFTGRFVGLPESDSKPYRVRYGTDDDHLLQFGSQYEQQALNMQSAENQIGYQLSRQAFRQSQELITQWGGQLVVVLIPTREEVYSHLTAPVMGDAAIDRLASAREAMRQLCDELSLRCYDPTATLQDHAQAGEALYYSDDMHLNPHGNAVLAEALTAWLDDNAIQTE